MGTVDVRAAAISAAVFVCGAVLLGVEIAASRVLAPFFGNSLFVWGALIGVVLAGLAIGYAAGGALSDRLPRAGLLVGVILLGSTFVLLVPVLDQHVLEFVVTWDPGARLDPLLAAVFLFGAPSVVLAAVTPIAVRLRAREVAGLGRTAGRLFSVSTVGSIAGTFATAFWLVPDYGVEQLFAVGAAALFAAAAVVAAAERLWLPVGVAALACAGAVGASFALAPESGQTLAGVAAKNWSPVFRDRAQPVGSGSVQFAGKVVFQKDTQYHRLAVVDSGDQRELRFDSSFQSAMSLTDPYKTEYEYTDYLQLGLAYNPAARNVLMIGLGGASAPKRFLRDHPVLNLQIVELDPVVVQVARRYFRLPPDGPRLHTTVEDGRRYLTRTDRKWDVIVIDAFYSDAIPFHLATLEFMELLRRRLAPDGVVVTNIIGAITGSGSELFRSMFRTYRAGFPSVVVHPVGSSGPGDDGSSINNLIVVASANEAPSKQTLLARWRNRRGVFRTAPDLTRAILGRWSHEVSPAGVPVLTDDYAPTDALLAD
jgi:spermidine synthase